MPDLPISVLRLRCVLLVLVMLTAGWLPAGARAATSASFEVSATVTAGCLVDGLGASGNAGRIGTLDFGEDSTFSNAVHTATTTATQAIRLRCSPGVTLRMTIDGGAHVGNSTRNLQRGATQTARIPYTLCRDAACTQLIGINVQSTMVITTANTEDVRLPIYGRLTLPGTLPPGTYTDTLTVTLTF